MTCLRSRLWVLLTFGLPVLVTAAQASDGDRGTFVDPRDGHVYETVRIGGLEWFAENLDHEIPGSWCYEDQAASCRRYGRLYEWPAAVEASPPGWRLPTDEDWQDLERALGMKDEEIARPYGPRGTLVGGLLKPGGGSHFEALLAGHRGPDGGYTYQGSSGDFWSSTEHNAEKAVTRQVIDDSDGVVRNICSKRLGMSVRCVRSAGSTE